MTLVTTITRHNLWNKALKRTEMEFSNSLSDTKSSVKDICIIQPVSMAEITSNLNKFDKIIITYVSPDVEVATSINLGRTLEESLADWGEATAELLETYKRNRRSITLVNLEEISYAPSETETQLQALGWNISGSLGKEATTFNRLIANQSIRENEELYNLIKLLEASSIKIFDKETNPGFVGPLNYLSENNNAFKKLFDQLLVSQKRLEEVCREKGEYADKFERLRFENKEIEKDKEKLLNQVFASQQLAETFRDKFLAERALKFKESERYKKANGKYVNNISMLKFQNDSKDDELSRLRKPLIIRYLSAIKHTLKKFTAKNSLNDVRYDDVLLVYKSSYFDVQWYIQKNRDLKNSGIDPVVHYLKYGAKEGRDPSKVFHTNWYLSRYSDIDVNKINPLLHFIKFGESEKRLPVPANKN